MTTHVLFDFFGTLVDYSATRTELGYEKSFNLVREAGANLDYEGFLSLWSEVFAQLEGAAEQSHREFSMIEVGDAFVRRAGGVPHDGLARDLAKTYVAEWNKGVSYSPGVTELLERLSRRFALAVITNTHDPSLVPDHLERMGVSRYFEQVITSVEVGVRKPARHIFEHALRALRASRHQCVYVGDSYEADYQGAQGAGIRSLLIDPLHKARVPSEDRLASILLLEGRLAEQSGG